ncbi:MAG TPA: tetratricopeptide repeat protein [Pyrinomonadaceae bacterium]|jgi:Flp pilus assembly protein TadD|nr:tetratricopeptide repeat protein [Pyrinomonadaceae bacterium]
MRARAQIFSCRRLLALAAACAFALRPAAASVQGGEGSGASVTTAQVTQAVARVRSSAPDERTRTQALALGGALLREGRFAEAAELFGALAEKFPRDPSILYGAALATFNAGRAAEAEPLARNAVDAALAAAQTTKAGSAFASAANGSAADALVLLGVVLAVRGDDAGALKSVGQAVRLAPGNFDAQLALGRALYGAGDDASAVRAFRAASALRPSDAQARFFLATALEHAGDNAGALAAYRELVARQPAAAEGHLGLGVLLLKRGGSEAEEGLRELARALEINPQLYEARVTLGRALVERGRAGEAVEHLRRAAELAPGNPEPHYQLSLAYRRLGRKEEAAAESVIVRRIHESRRGGAHTDASAPPDE